MARDALSAAATLVHTEATPPCTRCGSSTMMLVTSLGDTAGRMRYVRAHPSAVVSSCMTTPIGMPRG